MGVVLALELRRPEQARPRDAVGDGLRRAALADPLEHVGHLRLEVQPAVEDDVRLLEPAQVALARLVEVRIDAGAHQPLDVDAAAADLLDDVRDHPDRRHDLDRLPVEHPRRRRLDRPAPGEDDGEEGSGEKFRHA